MKKIAFILALTTSCSYAQSALPDLPRTCLAYAHKAVELSERFKKVDSSHKDYQALQKYAVELKKDAENMVNGKKWAVESDCKMAFVLLLKIEEMFNLPEEPLSNLPEVRLPEVCEELVEYTEKDYCQSSEPIAQTFCKEVRKNNRKTRQEWAKVTEKDKVKHEAVLNQACKTSLNRLRSKKSP